MPRLRAWSVRTRFVSVVLVLFALALGGGLGWSITNGVTQPIGRAVVVAERIADGDLTSEVEVRIHDETGRLLAAIRAMQARLRELVGGIPAGGRLHRGLPAAEVAAMGTRT